MAAVLGDPVTEPGSEGEALERHEVGSEGAADVDAAAGRIGLVTLEERVTGRFLQILGGTVEVVVVGGIRRDVTAGRVVGLHVHRRVLDVGDVRRRERIDGDHGVQRGTVTIGNGLAAPFLDGIVRGDREPLEELIVGIDLRGNTVIGILLAHHDTVVVHEVERGEEVTLLVTALEDETVLLAPAGLESGVVPVGIGAVVVVGSQQFIGDVTDIFLILDIFLGTEDIGLLAQGLHREAAVVGDMGRAFLTGLGGDEHDTVTGLRTVDGGGGGVLQDLDGLDHGRIQILDVVHLQTIDDEERSDVAGVGGVTADTDVSALARSTGGVDDLDTGGLALQGGGGVGGGTVLQVLGTDRCHGAGQVALALDAVTDDDGLIQEFSVLDEDELE